MFDITVFENTTFHVIVKNTETTEKYEYHWGKEPPEGQDKEEYLENCKREAILLTEEKLITHDYAKLSN